MNDLPVTLDQLAARLETLEQRVHILECPSGASANSVVPDISAPAPSLSIESITYPQTAGLFSVLGKAMLGIAGAYLLRALAESTALPITAIAAIAIAYAITWLVWAVRVQSETCIPTAIYAGISALILAPMLWELTLSFKVLSPAAAAAVLALFVFAASGLAWKRDLTPVFWIANLAAAITAMALSVATRELIPFLVALLLMSLLSEVAANCDRARSLRPLVALAADLAISISIFIYSGPQSARPDYPALSTLALLAPASALFFLYASSIALRTTLLRRTITAFEILQTTISFALAAFSVLTFAPQFGSVGLGAACLFFSAASYAIALTAARKVKSNRNHQVYAAWATALLIAGSILCMPPFGQALCLALAAIAFTLLGERLQRLTDQAHGLVLLAAAAIASGLLDYAFHSLAGTLPYILTPGASVALVCALGCYAAARPALTEARMRHALRLIPASLVACTLAAMLVHLLLSLAALRIVPEVQHIAFLRTLSICTVALALAFAAARWRRPELKIIAYAALALVAAKLVLEDLRHGHFEFIAASIFLFAISLILVPRLAPVAQKT
jgi:hypothetical protein